jgi:arylsulfatase A-like enzyme
MAPPSPPPAARGLLPTLACLLPRLARLLPRLARLLPRLARLLPRLARLLPRLARLLPRLAWLLLRLAWLLPRLPCLLPRLACLLAGASLLAPGACSPAGPDQLAVLQRDLDWTRAPLPAAATVAQSLHWDADGILDQWIPVRAQVTRDDDALRLTGLRSFELRAPEGVIDGQRHDLIALTLATSGVDALALAWDGVDGKERSFDLPVTPGDELAETVVRLTPLQQSATVSGLRLVVSGPSSGTLDVALAGIAFVSELDVALAQGLAARPLVRDGVRMAGHVLALPGALQARVPGGPGQHLRLHLACAGRASPLSVHIEDTGGRLAAQQLTLTPGDGWRAVTVELSALAADEQATLTITADDGPGFLLAGGVTRVGPDGARRPDVTLWLVDTLRPDRLGSYGYDLPTDPALERMAAEGVRFERTYSVSNWTRPSVSSLLTGVGADVHGNHAPGQAIALDLPTLAEELGRAGYLTLSLITNHHAGAESGLDRGFDLQYEPSHFPRLDPPSTLTSGQILDALAPLLAEHPGQRLFLSLHCLDPHGPYLPVAGDVAAIATARGGASPRAGTPADQRIRFSERSPDYDAEILHADRSLDRFDRLLADVGRREDTLLAFVSDHGEGFYEHGTWGHWRDLHDEEVRIPWVLRWPADLPAGRVVSEAVGLVDVAPTLVALAGLTPPPAWTGRDLSAVCRGAEAPRDAPHVMDATAGGPHGSGRRRLSVVRGQWKLHAELDDAGRLQPRALFDLERDPLETKDLLVAGRDPSELLRSLVEYLQRDGQRQDAGPTSDVIDPEQLRWLKEMGYLGR